MTIEIEVGQHLKADAAVLALVEDRVFAQIAPPASHKKDRIIFNRIAVDPIGTLDGPTGLVKTRIQLGCFSQSYIAAHDLAGAVNDSLAGYKGMMGAIDVRSSTRISETDEYDEATKNHWVALLFSFLHKES